MILSIDVQYSGNTAFVAGVAFKDWCSESPEKEFVSILHDIAEYEPGNFYKRELPCILRLIEEHNLMQETIVIDGYVFLDVERRHAKRVLPSSLGSISPNALGVIDNHICLGSSKYFKNKKFGDMKWIT